VGWSQWLLAAAGRGGGLLVAGMGEGGEKRKRGDGEGDLRNRRPSIFWGLACECSSAGRAKTLTPPRPLPIKFQG
jgi:hypothetical protein